MPLRGARRWGCVPDPSLTCATLSRGGGGGGAVAIIAGTRSRACLRCWFDCGVHHASAVSSEMPNLAEFSGSQGWWGCSYRSIVGYESIGGFRAYQL
jgi:hypothetical protein